MYKTVKPFTAAAARSVKFVSKSQNFLVFSTGSYCPDIMSLIYEEGTCCCCVGAGAAGWAAGIVKRFWVVGRAMGTPPGT